MERLYDDLTPFYRLLTPAEDYAEEAALYWEAMRGATDAPPRTLLELGAGAGHNALFLKQDVVCTLTDLSPAMLALSEALNPECEHVVGDMRDLRLGRTFDLVFAHDAITYMTSREDLEAAVETAFVHTRPGGAALFAPDCVTDTFRPGTEVHEADQDGLRLRCLEWAYDPDPTDETFVIDFAFLLQEGSSPDVRFVHDRHRLGVFDEATWLGLIEGAGFSVERVVRDTAPLVDAVFLARRPR